jgi:hypothetical protein
LGDLKDIDGRQAHDRDSALERDALRDAEVVIGASGCAGERILNVCEPRRWSLSR